MASHWVTSRVPHVPEGVHSRNSRCSVTGNQHSVEHPPSSLCGCRYETSNHLWLILEYCVGGDLMSLLRQDMRLPEASIHDLARDLVSRRDLLGY